MEMVEYYFKLSKRFSKENLEGLPKPACTAPQFSQLLELLGQPDDENAAHGCLFDMMIIINDIFGINTNYDWNFAFEHKEEQTRKWKDELINVFGDEDKKKKFYTTIKLLDHLCGKKKSPVNDLIKLSHPLRDVKSIRFEL